MQDQKKYSPFEFLIFNPIPHNESQKDKNRVALFGEDIGQEDTFLETPSSSDIDSGSDDDCFATPEIAKSCDMSVLLLNIDVPKNSLSSIGDPTEKKLLKITNSPNVGAMTEVRNI